MSSLAGGEFDLPQYALCLRSGSWAISGDSLCTPTRGGELLLSPFVTNASHLSDRVAARHCGAELSSSRGRGTKSSGKPPIFAHAPLMTLLDQRVSRSDEKELREKPNRFLRRRRVRRSEEDGLCQTAGVTMTSGRNRVPLSCGGKHDCRENLQVKSSTFDLLRGKLLGPRWSVASCDCGRLAS